MRYTLAIAALVGATFAAPSQEYAQNEVKNVHMVVETVVQTVYVTEGYEAPQPTPTPEAVKETPAATTVVYQAPAQVTQQYAEKPVVAPTPTPTPEYVQPTTTTSSTPAPTTTQATETGYMAVVQEWRAKLGLKALTHDDTLESNAMDVVVSGNGQMVHKLNPGTYGQVLAPGDASDFEHVFVGGWLCEIPTLPGLDGVCAKQSEGWSYEGQTGHADILTSPNYSKIACANTKGIWCCDLA